MRDSLKQPSSTPTEDFEQLSWTPIQPQNVQQSQFVLSVKMYLGYGGRELVGLAIK